MKAFHLEMTNIIVALPPCGPEGNIDNTERAILKWEEGGTWSERENDLGFCGPKVNGPEVIFFSGQG